MLIRCLFAWRSPSAVAWLVVAIVVNAVNRVVMAALSNPAFWIWRTWTHVLQKCIGTLAPALTDRNPSSAVVFVRWIPWVVAAANHALPRTILLVVTPHLHSGKNLFTIASVRLSVHCIKTLARRWIRHASAVPLSLPNKQSYAQAFAQSLTTACITASGCASARLFATKGAVMLNPHTGTARSFISRMPAFIAKAVLAEGRELFATGSAITWRLVLRVKGIAVIPPLVIVSAAVLASIEGEPAAFNGAHGRITLHRNYPFGVTRLGIASAAAAFLLPLIIAFGVSSRLAAEAANPPDSHQPNPDVFACCSLPSVFSGWTAGDLSTLNPLTQKLRGGSRTVTYSFLVVPGCAAGNMQDTLQTALRSTTDVTGVTFMPVSTGGDLTIRATCGVDAANMGLTGGAICDLYPSWPYKNQVNCSTTMATFYELSQVTIWNHEIAGHALASAGEGYLLDGSFSAAPGFISYMNTGPQSRTEAWPPNDVARWERVVYPLTVEAPPYQDCTTYPDWPGTTSCFWPSLNAWLWTIPLNNHDSLWRWSADQPRWTCIEGCP